MRPTRARRALLCDCTLLDDDWLAGTVDGIEQSEYTRAKMDPSRNLLLTSYLHLGGIGVQTTVFTMDDRSA
jgi:hypothetical protein